MEEIDVNSHLIKEDLFQLFKQQLKKDFEGAGIDAEFTDTLASQFDALKSELILALNPLLKNTFSALSNLLYRIDISEMQIKTYQQKNPTYEFEEILAELIIKRILQKVILKKRFSK